MSLAQERPAVYVGERMDNAIRQRAFLRCLTDCAFHQD